MSKKNAPRRAVTDEAVKRAIAIRENGGSWKDVIDATGFNGAILRPHMRAAGYEAAQAVPKAKKATPKAVATARLNSAPWYAIAQSFGITEAAARKLAREGGCPEEAMVGRVYLSTNGKPLVTRAVEEGRNGRQYREAGILSTDDHETREAKRAAAAKAAK